MATLRRSLTSLRLALPLLFLLVAMRALSPAGFMPDWTRGHLVLRLCDGFAQEPVAHAHPMHGHGHHKSDHAHRDPCPYAASAVQPLLGSDPPALVGFLVLAIAILLGRTFLFAERQRIDERPRVRGPPAHALS